MTETTTTTLPTPEIRTSAPAETLTAPITSPAPTTSAQKMMTPNGYTLFMRGHVLILRCLSDGAVNNFYNVDRVPSPTPHAIERIRQQARALAQRNGVAFTDFLQTRPTPQTKPAPRKLICLSMTSRAVRHRAKKHGKTAQVIDRVTVIVAATNPATTSSNLGSPLSNTAITVPITPIQMAISSAGRRTQDQQTV
jgi:hypothetical protein